MVKRLEKPPPDCGVVLFLRLCAISALDTCGVRSGYTLCWQKINETGAQPTQSPLVLALGGLFVLVILNRGYYTGLIATRAHMNIHSFRGQPFSEAKSKGVIHTMMGLLVKLIVCPAVVYLSSVLLPQMIYYPLAYQPIVVGLILAVAAHTMEVFFLKRGTFG